MISPTWGFADCFWYISFCWFPIATRVALMAYIYIYTYSCLSKTSQQEGASLPDIPGSVYITEDVFLLGKTTCWDFTNPKGEPANNNDFLGGYEPPTKTNLCWQPPIIIVAGYGWVTLGAHPSGTWPAETWYREAGIKKHDVYRQIWGPHPVCVIFVCSPIFC